MEYEGHVRAVIPSTFPNAVSHGQGHSGAKIALMSTQTQDQSYHQRPSERERSHNQQANSHHLDSHNRSRQQLCDMATNAVSSTHSASSLSYYSTRIVEPYLQSELLQGTQGFHRPHTSHCQRQVTSSVESLELSAVAGERGKADTAIAIDRSQGFEILSPTCNYVVSSNGETVLANPSLDSTGHANHEEGPSLPSRSMADRDDLIRTKIVSHPSYPRLVMAYVNCYKIGAPEDAALILEEVSRKYQEIRSSSSEVIGADPELDNFMELYCNVLQRYHEELTHPYKEAMAFFKKIELQLDAISKGSLSLSQSGETKTEANSDSAWHGQTGAAPSIEDEPEEGDMSSGEVDFHDEMIDPLAEDQKLKEQLLRKYSGYIFKLKQEFLKKKKKGKLPREARQMLLDWWTQHYKWPYPSEAEKTALAESTGLDQKQINNWFINQRKRHWKPSEDMQYVMMDSPAGQTQHTFLRPHSHIASQHLSPYTVLQTMEVAAGAAPSATMMSSLH
ncbi:hypothetical protein KP509_20G046300 [Ceratopteris richardii]|uniref:Uncharacterized protein n=3 Tax=Ceratopteris richardii TaxID=49495 RepID=A0A8T2SGR3_CERRI|nr:hypothetical protein KP509_20G046300 [Ceratopteris richardii]